jgi:hypothetical protein
MLGSFSSGKVGFGILLTAKDAFSENFGKFRNELSLTNAATAKFTKTLTKAASVFAGMGALSLGVGMIAGFLKDATMVAAEYQQIEIAIKSIAGGDLPGGKLMQDLRAFTLKSPLEFKDTVKNTKLLLAYGVGLDTIMDDVEMLTELSAGVGLDKFPFLALAYGQVMSLGKATGQEVNQFANAGIGIYKEVGKLYNMSTGAVREKYGTAILTATNVRKALMAMTQEGGNFFNLVDKQMKSFKGMLSILRDVFYFIQVELGTLLTDRYKGALQKLVDIGSKFTEFLFTDKGNSTMQAMLRFFEIFAVGVLITTIFIALKFMFLLTGFLLPTAIRQTFMLALANNNLAGAFRILGASMLSGLGFLFNMVLIMGQLAFAAYVVHNVFKNLFGSNYISDFVTIVTGALDLMMNYDPFSDTTLLTDQTSASLEKVGGVNTAMKLFYIYTDIRRVIFGIGQGVEITLGFFYKILSVVGGLLKKLAQFFGFFKKGDGLDEVGGEGAGFMNNNAARNIGRLIGVYLAIKLIIGVVKKAVAGFKILRAVIIALGNITAFKKVGMSLVKMLIRSRNASNAYIAANSLSRSRADSKYKKSFAARTLLNNKFFSSFKGAFPAMGKLVAKFAMGILNGARGIKAMAKGMNVLTIAARIFSFVTNKGLQMLRSKLMMIPIIILLIVGLIIAAVNLLSEYEGGEWFANSWIGRKMGYESVEGKPGGWGEKYKDATLTEPSETSAIPTGEMGSPYKSWLPNASGTMVSPIILSTNIQIDGETVAKSVQKHQQKKNEIGSTGE